MVKFQTFRPVANYSPTENRDNYSPTENKCELSLKVLQIANFSQITHSPTFGRAFTW